MLKKLFCKKSFFSILFIIISNSLIFNAAVGAEREDAIVRAVRKVSPAVVNISSEYEVRTRANPFAGMDPFFDSFFRDFFEGGVERQYKKNSLGSGVIIDGKRGFILTNAHVIERTGKISVILKDEREFEAQIVGADPDSDLAVLRISSQEALPAAEMGISDDLMIGETVIAIGNPFGFSHTVTTGVISAVGRSIRTEERVYHDFIQTDASINPGNSGGPLLNVNGELIGVNTAIYAKAQGIGFAIPVTKAKRIIADLISHGEVVQAWIGLMVQDIDAGMSRYLKTPAGRGVLVREVESGSPAEKADIRAGDIVLSVGKDEVASSEDYLASVKGIAAGDTVLMLIRRNNSPMTVSVKTAAFPVEKSADIAFRLLGVRVAEAARAGSYERGVVISEIRRDCYLAGVGVRPGDVIRQLDDITINNVKDFEKAIVKYRNKASVVILLQRGDQGYYITVRL